jgi:hypothetical protein
VTGEASHDGLKPFKHGEASHDGFYLQAKTI